MNYQKYTSINIPKNMELKQIFIAQNTFDYWMILEESRVLKVYKNGAQIWVDLIWYGWNYWVISNSWNIISHLWRKQDWESETIKSISINWVIPKNEYIFFQFPVEFNRTRDWEYLFSIGQNLDESEDYMTRNWETIFSMKYLEYWTYNKLWAFITKNKNDNKIYLNNNILLFEIPPWWKLEYLELFDNLAWNLVYQKNGIFYVIQNGKNIKQIILEKWLIFNGNLFLNTNWDKLYLPVSINTESDDNFWVSINGLNPVILFNQSYYNVFMSNDKNSIIYKCGSMEKRKFFIVQDENIIFESKNLLDNESQFYLWNIKWFENNDINILFHIGGDKKIEYSKKYNELKEKIQKDFDKIESLVIWDDWLIKFIWYKQDNIWLYYFHK